jgi:hypothetical protein
MEELRRERAQGPAENGGRCARARRTYPHRAPAATRLTRPGRHKALAFPASEPCDNVHIIHAQYSWPSTDDKTLDQALATARSLPPNAQDDIAHVVLRLAGVDDEPPVPLTPEEKAAIAASKAAAARGEFATDDEVRAVWAKHGL